MRNITEVITEEQAQQLDKSYEAYLNGTAKYYTLEEVTEMALSRFKGIGNNKKQTRDNHFRASSVHNK